MTGRAVGANDLCTSGIGEVQGIDPAAAARSAVVTAGLALRHPCELSKAKGIKTCHQPDHTRDREQFRAALLTLGLLEAQAREPAKGRCPGCKRTRKLNNDGRMAAHDGPGGDRCAGWRRHPERGGTP